MNKEELIKEVAKKTKTTQKQAAEIITVTMDVITKEVAKGKKVKVVGFGTFEARKRAGRKCRNPQTKEEMYIPSKNVPVFNAGKKFRASVNPNAPRPKK